MRARTQRRAEERRYVDLVRDKERLARLEPGGNAERPIAVVSASLVEPHARSIPCPLCGGALRVEEHTAEAGLRVVRAICTQCSARRALYFRIEGAPN